MTEFGKLSPDGSYVKIRTLSQAAMLACPFKIMVPEHYREDESCLCDDAKHRLLMMSEWEYTEEDFKDIPLRQA